MDDVVVVVVLVVVLVVLVVVAAVVVLVVLLVVVVVAVLDAPYVSFPPSFWVTCGPLGPPGTAAFGGTDRCHGLGPGRLHQRGALESFVWGVGCDVIS